MHTFDGAKRSGKVFIRDVRDSISRTEMMLDSRFRQQALATFSLPYQPSALYFRHQMVHSRACRDGSDGTKVEQ